MIAALYLRSATQNDDAIAAQHRVCTAHAVARGWSVGETCIDNGVGGIDEYRPGLNALRDCLRDGRASILIAEDGARLFRDMDKLGEFFGFCEALGVEVSFTTSSTATSDLMRLHETQKQLL